MLDNGAKLVVKATLQQTPDRLLPIDKLSIGGVYTVRGFRQNQLLRDVGGIVNLEFDYPIARAAGKGLNASVVPFYDYGRGKNKGENAATLSSAGLAARAQWQGFSLDLVFAKRLQVPRFGVERKTTLQDQGINFQLSYAFF